MASKAKRSRARTAQLRQRRVARRRHRQKKIEAAADLKPIGSAKRPEEEQRRRRRAGAQQRRHDRRRRRGQANRDPGAVYPNSPQSQIGFGVRPAGGEGQRHPSGKQLFVGIVGPNRVGVLSGKAIKLPAKKRAAGQPVGRSGNQKRRRRRARVAAQPAPARGHAHLGRAG